MDGELIGAASSAAPECITRASAARACLQRIVRCAGRVDLCPVDRAEIDRLPAARRRLRRHRRHRCGGADAREPGREVRDEEQPVKAHAARGAIAAIAARSSGRAKTASTIDRMAGRDDAPRLVVERRVDLRAGLRAVGLAPAAARFRPRRTATLRSTSERSSTAPGAGGTSGASVRASTDLPVPGQAADRDQRRRRRRDQAAGEA